MPNGEDKKRKFYNSLVNSGRVNTDQVGSYDTFVQNTSTQEGVRKLYDGLSSAGFSVEELGSFDTFSSNLGAVKKKEPSKPSGGEYPLKSADVSEDTGMFLSKDEMANMAAEFQTPNPIDYNSAIGIAKLNTENIIDKGGLIPEAQKLTQQERLKQIDKKLEASAILPGFVEVDPVSERAEELLDQLNTNDPSDLVDYWKNQLNEYYSSNTLTVEKQKQLLKDRGIPEDQWPELTEQKVGEERFDQAQIEGLNIPEANVPEGVQKIYYDYIQHLVNTDHEKVAKFILGQKGVAKKTATDQFLSDLTRNTGVVVDEKTTAIPKMTQMDQWNFFMDAMRYQQSLINDQLVDYQIRSGEEFQAFGVEPPVDIDIKTTNPNTGQQETIYDEELGRNLTTIDMAQASLNLTAQEFIKNFPEVVKQQEIEKQRRIDQSLRQRVADREYEMYKNGEVNASEYWIKNNILYPSVNASANLIDGMLTLPHTLAKGVGFETEFTNQLAEFSEENIQAANLTAPTAYQNFRDEDGSINWEGVIYKTTSSAADMATLLIPASQFSKAAQAAKVINSAKAANNVGLFTSSFVNTHRNSYREAIAAGLTEEQAADFAIGSTTVSSLIELVSPNQLIMNGSFAKRLKDEGIKKVVKGATTKDAIKESLGSLSRELGLENVQEISQLYADVLSKGVANEMLGREAFDTDINTDDIMETVLVTSLTTLPLSTVGAFESRTGIDKRWNYMAALEKDRVISKVEAMVKDGQLDQVDADQIKEKVEKYAKIVEGLPEGLTQTQQGDLADLVYQKQLWEDKEKQAIVDPVVEELSGNKIQNEINKIDEQIARELKAEEQLVERAKAEEPTIEEQEKGVEQVKERLAKDAPPIEEEVEDIDRLSEEEFVKEKTDEALAEFPQKEQERLRSQFENIYRDAHQKRQQELETEKLKEDDSETRQQVRGQERRREEEVEQAPIEEGRDEETETGRVLQEPTEQDKKEEITADKEKRPPTIQEVKEPDLFEIDEEGERIPVKKETLVKRLPKIREKAFKKGKKEGKKQVDAIREKLQQWVDDHDQVLKQLDTKLRPALLRRINRVKTEKQAQDAIDYLTNIVEKDVARKEAIDVETKLKKIDKKLDLKTYAKTEAGIRKGKKISPEAIDRIAEVAKVREMDVEKAQDEIDSIILNAVDDQKLPRTLTPEEQERIAVLELAGIDNMDGKGLEIALINLDQLIEEGREEKRKKNEETHQRLEKGKSTVKVAFTGGKPIKPRATVASQQRERGIFKEIQQRAINFFNNNEAWQGIVEQIDRSKDTSKTKRLLVDPINEARSKYRASFNTTIREVQDKKEEIWGSKEAARKAGKEANKTIELGEFQLEDGGFVELAITKDQAGYIYNLMKDRSLDSTFDKMGWTQEIKDAINNIVVNDPKLQEYVDWMIDEFYPKMYKKINKTYRDIYGINMPFNSKYTPLRRVGVDQPGIDVINMNSFNNSAYVTNGSLKERKRNTKEIDIHIGAETMLYDYINKMERFKSFGQPMRDISRIMFDGEVQKAITQENGKQMNDLISTFLSNIANNSIDNGNKYVAVDKLRTGFTVAALGVNPVVMLKQLSSFAAYMADVNSAKYIKEFTQMIAEGGVGAKAFREDLKRLTESEYIKDRYQKGFDRDMVEAMAKDAHQTFTDKKKWQDILMTPTKWGDKGAIIFGGLPLYRVKYREALEAGLPEEGAREAALDAFVESTRNAQQSSEIEDLSAFQRGGSFPKLFTMFKTSQSQYFRHSRSSIRNISRGRGSLRDWKRLAMYNVTLPAIFTWVARGFDTEEEDREEMLRNILTTNTSGLLFAGDLINYIADKIQGKPFDYSVVPAIERLKRPIDVINEKLTQDEELKFEDILEMSVPLVEGVTGLPVKNVKRLTYDNFIRYKENGFDDWRNFVGYSKFVTQGEESTPVKERPSKKTRRRVKRQRTTIRRRRE